MLIRTFQQAEQFLALHIPKTSVQTFPGELGLKRAKYFLHLLGDPQEKIKVIHVAGTSGKGSTCYLISSLLESQGFKVGLHQSPHLINVTERFQIGNVNIAKKEFVYYLNKIIPIIDRTDGACSVSTKLTYFEILVGLAFYIFAKKGVDYAVMETGLGGKYDGTNVVSRSDKLAVLTKIGLDHTNILGKTIEEIAFQKAMIINEKSQMISIYQDIEAEKVIREVAEKKKAKIAFVGRDVINHVFTKNMGLAGEYQKENASLALEVVNFLSKRDGFIIDQNKIKKVFEKAKFPGRFDIRKIPLAQASKSKTIIFDGAHNPQKMEAFINSLIKKYPNKKFNFLLAFKKGKDYQKMLKIIILKTAVHKIIITSFLTDNQDMINVSEEPEEIGEELKQIQSDEIRFNQIKLETIIIPDLKKAWETILKEKELIVVTGSLYLVGEIYRLIKSK
ncbi:MAG: Mur ligase family protein [Patescibacteria group bacterium]